MKRSAVFAVACVVVLATTYIAAIKPAGASADSWVMRAPIPVPMSVYGAAAVNGQVYVFGQDADWKALTYAFDPSNDTWTAKAPMPTLRSDFAVVACQNQIYAIGGVMSDDSYGNALMTNVNEAYDPSTNSWSTKTPMPTNRTAIQANAVDNKIYVIGGLIGNMPGPTLTSANEIYDSLTDTWSIGAPIPTPVFSYVSTVLDDKIYVIGGEVSDGSCFSSANQIYNPTTDSWTVGKSLPTLTVQAVCAATTGVNAPARIYVIGGRLSRPVDATQIYDASNDDWTSGASFPTTHDYITEYMTVAVLDDSLYVIGGLARSNEGFYELTEQYIPADYQGPVPSPYVPTSSPIPTSRSSPTVTQSPTSQPSATPNSSHQSTPATSYPETLDANTALILGATITAVIVILLTIVALSRRKNKSSFSGH